MSVVADNNMIGRSVADHADYGAAAQIGQVNDCCQHAFHGFLMPEGLLRSRGPVIAEFTDFDDPVERKSNSIAFGVAAAYGVLRGSRIFDIHDVRTVMTFECNGPQEVIAKVTFASVHCATGAQQHGRNNGSTDLPAVAEPERTDCGPGRPDRDSPHLGASITNRHVSYPVSVLAEHPDFFHRPVYRLVSVRLGQLGFSRLATV